MILIKGIVVRKTKGFYYILEDNHGNFKSFDEFNNSLYECKLRGILKAKNDKMNCIIGDIIEFDKEKSVITKVFPRINFLERPLISNIDSVCMTYSIKNPEFDIINFQKKLLWIHKNNLTPILILTKIDLVEDEFLSDFIENMKKIFPYLEIYPISVVNKKGLENLKNSLLEKKSVIAGPSGVGKSTLINDLVGNDFLKTSEVSTKTKRGRHTTTETRFIPFDKNTIFIDTPGFSALEFPSLKNKKDLENFFPEIKEKSINCKFNDCIHIKEPNCFIKESVENGSIPLERYNFYLLTIKNLDKGKEY